VEEDFAACFNQKQHPLNNFFPKQNQTSFTINALLIATPLGQQAKLLQKNYFHNFYPISHF